MEGFPETLPFLQNGQPTQARLEGLEDQELELDPIVVDGDTPLAIVVTQEQWVRLRPWTPYRRSNIAPVQRLIGLGRPGLVVWVCNRVSDVLRLRFPFEIRPDPPGRSS